MRLQNGPESPVFMCPGRTGRGGLGFFLLRRRAVGILGRGRGRRRGLLLRVLLRRTGRRGDVVDHEISPAGTGFGLTVVGISLGETGCETVLSAGWVVPVVPTGFVWASMDFGSTSPVGPEHS